MVITRLSTTPTTALTMALKTPDKIDRIVDLGNNTYAVVLNSKDDATLCLRKNPRAQYIVEGDEQILIYSSAEIDLSKAIRRL